MQKIMTNEEKQMREFMTTNKTAKEINVKINELTQTGINDINNLNKRILLIKEILKKIDELLNKISQVNKYYDNLKQQLENQLEEDSLEENKMLESQAKNARRAATKVVKKRKVYHGKSGGLYELRRSKVTGKMYKKYLGSRNSN